MAAQEAIDLRKFIRDVPGFPNPEVLFRDITPLLGDARAFNYAVDSLIEPFVEKGVDRVAAIEARGFLVGAAMAVRLGVGIVPLRKKGKLPSKLYSEPYELEYGTERLEMHIDGVQPEEDVLVVDDVIATGGTGIASINLVKRGGAVVKAVCSIIDLPNLGGSQRIRDQGVEVSSLLDY